MSSSAAAGRLPAVAPDGTAAPDDPGAQDAIVAPDDGTAPDDGPAPDGTPTPDDGTAPDDEAAPDDGPPVARAVPASIDELVPRVTVRQPALRNRAGVVPDAPAFGPSARPSVERAAEPSRADAATLASPMPDISPSGPVAGAYLPPSAAFAVPTTAAGRSVARSTEASASGGAVAAVALTPGRAGWIADLPFEAPDDLAGWLAASAAAAVAVGFVLPWGDNGVIGGGLDAGYFSRWGLANAANVIPIAAAVAVLWFELSATSRRNRLGTGLAGLLLGGPLTGVAFTYATSPFGLGVGGVVVVLASIVLVGVGLFALVRRHVEAAPGV
ncbi:MAG TPA: hypothetical protein VFI28_05630 [Candidatus Limnocylindrales bacterium]|nr:hypothetical protein [Candidatus Limnocylindrales bacterium]